MKKVDRGGGGQRASGRDGASAVASWVGGTGGDAMVVVLIVEGCGVRSVRRRPSPVGRVGSLLADVHVGVCGRE